MPNGSTGVVKWLSNDGAYGFIRADSDEDIFIHVSKLEHGSRPLERGMAVTFNVKATERGKAAVNVRRIQPETTSSE